jgi:hypothetical protein
MENIDDINQWRIAELMDRITTHHYRHDLTVIMKGWDCVRKPRYEVHVEDGVLIHVPLINMMDFYPSGYFECGSCHNLAPLSHEQHAYFNYNREHMICPACNDKIKHSMVPAYPRMCARVFGEPELDDSEHIRFITVTRPVKRAEIQRQIAVKRAERIAAANPTLHYAGGKSTQELYEDVLARRVLCRFRRFMTVRLRAKVAEVIAAVTGINPETAHGIAASL